VPWWIFYWCWWNCENIDDLKYVFI
jgi:hypothetical protein